MRLGWRAKIGLMVPSGNIGTLKAFDHYAPEGVVAITQRLLFETVTAENLKAMRPKLREAAKILNTPYKMDLLVFACTTGSMIGGLGYDAEICKELEDAFGVKTITTSMAVMEAIKALNMTSVCLVTPYPPEINEMEKEFLESNGVKVSSMKGFFAPGQPGRAMDLDYGDMHRLTKETLTEEADGIFMSCTGLAIAEYMGYAEKDFHLPVTCSNQANLWYALKTLGIPYDGPDIGSLMRK